MSQPTSNSSRCRGRLCRCPFGQPCPAFDYSLSVREQVKQLLLAMQAKLDREDYLANGQAYLPLASGYYDA